MLNVQGYWIYNIHQIYTVCTTSSYTEQAVRRLPDPTPLEGELWFVQAQFLNIMSHPFNVSFNWDEVMTGFSTIPIIIAWIYKYFVHYYFRRLSAILRLKSLFCFLKGNSVFTQYVDREICFPQGFQKRINPLCFKSRCWHGIGNNEGLVTKKPDLRVTDLLSLESAAQLKAM